MASRTRRHQTVDKSYERSGAKTADQRMVEDELFAPDDAIDAAWQQTPMTGESDAKFGSVTAADLSSFELDGTEAAAPRAPATTARQPSPAPRPAAAATPRPASAPAKSTGLIARLVSALKRMLR